MTPSYLNNTQSSFYLDLNEDQVPSDHHELTLKLHASASSSSSSSCPIFFNTPQYHQEVDDFFPRDVGSYDKKVEERGKRENELKFTIWKRDDNENCSQVKWMSSKMRLMKQMTKSDQDHDHDHDRDQQSGADTPNKTITGYQNQKNMVIDHHNDNNSNNGPIRVCADCNTTKTPLWRSGPRGPKSLCNACGIRQRKARRAAAAAAAAMVGGTALGATVTTAAKGSATKSHSKEKGSHGSTVAVQQKKRSKISNKSSPRDERKLCFEEFALNLSKKLSLQQVFFPQDEKEAAILLMALSSGLVQG